MNLKNMETGETPVLRFREVKTLSRFVKFHNCGLNADWDLTPHPYAAA
jgi:hypothetical protein